MLSRLSVVVGLVVLLFGLVGPGTAGAVACAANPRLSGTFLQPDLGDRWTTAQWTAELDAMKASCVTQLVLQWTADSKNKTTVYPSGLAGYTQSTSTDVVGRMLNAADAAGVDVYLGLQVNDDWWTKHANSQFLNTEGTVAKNVASDLWARYGSHPSIKGWYLAFEVDNVNFTTTKSWGNMAGFYTNVGNHLHALTPGKPIVTAPFYNSATGQTPAQWQQMWTYILQRSPLDVIALQDGVGAGHAAVAQLPAWFSATKNAIAAGRPATQLWADTETFNLDFKPMFIKDVVADMQAVQPYVTNYWSFSYNHYLSPQQVDPLFDQTYQNYLTTGTVETSAPSTPTGLSATAANSITINLSWSASTDNLGVAGYRIYRDGQLVWTQYSAATSFADGQLNPSTTYTYTVQAFDAAGNFSGQSASASATTPAGTNYPTNLAAGRPYTTTLAASGSYPDSGGSELTNGAYGAPVYTDGAWQGRNTGAVYSFTIDLGSTQSISEINSDWMQYRSVYIFLPKRVTYYTSTNNVSFTAVGTVQKPAVTDADQSKKYRLIDLVGVSGRYVKVEVEPSSSAWSFVDEAEVRR
jgi:hypothetical protein